MLTKREKDVLAAVAGFCFIWLLIAGVVAAYTFANERDAEAERAAQAQIRVRQMEWAQLESTGCRMVDCDRIGK